jgi:hypothetical protein
MASTAVAVVTGVQTKVRPQAATVCQWIPSLPWQLLFILFIRPPSVSEKEMLGFSLKHESEFFFALNFV